MALTAWNRDMRLRPFKALLAAHMQVTWNRSARELGRQGAWVVGLLVGLMGLFAAGPLFLGMGMLGWMAGQQLDRPLAPALLGGLLTLLGLGGGLLGGLIGGTRQLSWESYRGYPLKLRNLCFAELVAGIADPFPFFIGVALAGFLTGVGVGSPMSIPLLPLVLLETLLLLLALQLLVGGVAAALVKRLRLALAVIGILAWLVFTLTALRGPRGPKERPRDPAAQALRAQQRNARMERLAQAVTQPLSLLPGHASALSLAQARQGRWASALALHAYPLAILALLLIAGARLLARESRGDQTATRDQGTTRLWSFRTPAEGIGRLHFRTIMASQLGRFALLMPLLTLVLLKGPFSQLRGPSQWTTPAAFAYLAMVGHTFVLNQFGLDRHGVKSLLLLPLASRDLLLGKLLGAAAHHGLQALLLITLLAVFGNASPTSLIASTLMLGCLFLAQSAIGHYTSAWAPRPMALDSLKNSNLPFTVGLLSLATMGLWMSIYGGLYALIAWLAPVWLIPGMALAFLLTLGAHLALIPSAAAYLDRRREVLVERLG